MYVVCVTFRIKPGQIAAFLPLMQEQARNSLLREAGCHVFDVCQGIESQDDVFLYEVYDDRAAFELHLDSAHFKAFDAAVGTMVAEKQVQTFNRIGPGAE